MQRQSFFSSDDAIEEIKASDVIFCSRNRSSDFKLWQGKHKKKKNKPANKGRKRKKNPRISEFNNVKRFFIENVSKRPSSVFLTAIFNVAFKNDFSFTPRRSFFFFFIPAAPVLFFFFNFFCFYIAFWIASYFALFAVAKCFSLSFLLACNFFYFFNLLFSLMRTGVFFFFCIQIKDLCLL